MICVGRKLILTAVAIVTNLPTTTSFQIIQFPVLPVQNAASSVHVHRQNHQRRDFLQVIASCPIVVGLTTSLPIIVNAYGEPSNIVLPNYIDYLIEKNKQVDPKYLLYKGPDLEVQLRRIAEAANRLPEIAALSEKKKWNEVQGIITGPLGTLLQTMNSLSSTVGTKDVKDAAKLVKSDLIDISFAAGRKESSPCAKAAEKAAKDLEKFVLLL